MASASGDGVKLRFGSKAGASEKLIALSVATILCLVSMVLMLSCASPEFSWDEADYLAGTANRWGFLWGLFRDNRHYHGPLAVDLAKLGQEVLPVWAGSLENRLRFFEALAGSLAIGFLFWTLKRHFKTSSAAALAGSGLLLFSVIRLEETNVVGPHALMLLCTLAIAGLGYHWRHRPALYAALGLGSTLALGALSMAYVIPAALCWALAVGLAGAGWFGRERKYLKVSWSVLVMLAAAGIIILAVWPPGVLQLTIFRDFWVYAHWKPVVTLVGDRIFEAAPRWASAYWLARLDLPILFFSVSIISIALWKAFRGRALSSKHAWLVIFLAFFLTTALAAHIAGARNLLQFTGILCLAAGALFDEALGSEPRMLKFAVAIAVLVLGALNLAWLSQSSRYTPFIATDGYRKFLEENRDRLRQPAAALVYGSPVLTFYARQYGEPIAWKVAEIRWTTHADAPLPADTKYVLIPALVYDHMPPEQPMRRIVAACWKEVWSFQANHAWELRLYQNPQLP